MGHRGEGLLHRQRDSQLTGGESEDGPQMHLRYTLESQGKVLQSGDERLTNLSYMDRVSSYSSSNDPLRYEKQMIDDWFKKIVIKSKPAS